MTRKQIYAWMDAQIRAVEIINTPLFKDDYFRVCIAGAYAKKVHVYNIDELCTLLHKPWRVEAWDGRKDTHYFKYRGYKFFGLVDKEVK